ncbi:MAG TPA: BTAD domain-containing putative transcriptional regulator, partial [Acidimicrobiales bacterium]|nr:BTAD domain-containing putative transcriptional regulator [Acidimicrobiales bacterium]
MRIGLLGDLVVLGADDREIVVAGTKLRAFLALLALHAGRPVQTDQLVDALWGEDPPAAVRNSLQGLASKLRRTLGSTDVVAMRGGGYALELPPDAVDVHRYEQLVADARAAAPQDPAAALALLAEADDLWRGEPLAELAYEDFAAPAIARLSELRVAVVEERLELALQLGRHLAAVGELEALVDAHPLRERARGLLMTALYRAGRQADALRVFQDGRRILGEELGLEPGPELRQLEAAILSHDPSLDAPAVASVDRRAARRTLPEPLTPLVGRRDEVDELARLLTSERLVTLVGPGGVGKTRVAIEVARAVSGELDIDGHLVELAPVGDAGSVRAALADALELPDPNRLVELIGDRAVVLVLDNCEHVISTAAEVAEELLRGCPGLRVLATSREGLRVAGEHVWPVPPLPRADAVDLFLSRAAAAGGRLEATGESLATIADICDRLDGLPLAIELAAARTRAFPIGQLSDRLHDRFRVLTGGARTALPRQQTLRAVVDWSYDLLFDDEQRLFERLSIFPGGCDLTTARIVCTDDSLSADEIEDLVHALIEKSLIVPVPGGDDLRVAQLQTLAQYGREKLAERGDAGRVRSAMAAHLAALCAQSGTAYAGDSQRAWLTAVDAERDNLRAALEWAVELDDAETALTIAGGVSWPNWLRGTPVEGLRWVDEALACTGEASLAARAIGLAGRGLLRFQNGIREGVDDDLEAAIAMFRSLGDVSSLGMTYSVWAEVAAIRGDVDEAARRRREILEFHLRLEENDFVLGARAFGRAKLATLDGDLVVTEACYREALAHFARIDRPVMTAMTASMVADIDERAGRFDDASDLLQQSIDLGDALGLRGFTDNQLVRLAWARLQSGDLALAEPAYERTLDEARRLRNGRVEFLALAG